MDPTLPAVFTRREALEHGLTRHQVERRVATARWRQLRRAVYCLAAMYDAAGAARQHELEVTAALIAGPHDALVSHLSAACLLGWPKPLDGWGPATLTASPGTCARGRRGLVIQAATVRPVDRATRGGLATTSPTRTLADVLRHTAPAEAVAIADHALRTGQVQYEAVAEVLRWQEQWPYAARGRSSLLLADPRRETWLESWSFVTLHAYGVPLPEPQVDVLERQGRFVARLDGLWDLATAAEADGRVKYDLRGVLGAGADPQASADELVSRAQRRLDDEKLRRDRLNDLGLEVVRWGTAEVRRDPAALVRRVNARRASADASRFTGRFRFRPAPPWVAAINQAG